MTKVAIKSDKITSFGGIFHVMDVFSKLGLNQIIDSSLGQRGSTGTTFQYSDIISSLFYSYLCGADCLEDINTLVAQFSLSPKCTLPGADTVGRGLKELNPSLTGIIIFHKFSVCFEGFRFAKYLIISRSVF